MILLRILDRCLQYLCECHSCLFYQNSDIMDMEKGVHLQATKVCITGENAINGGKCQLGVLQNWVTSFEAYNTSSEVSDVSCSLSIICKQLVYHKNTLFIWLHSNNHIVYSVDHSPLHFVSYRAFLLAQFLSQYIQKNLNP